MKKLVLLSLLFIFMFSCKTKNALDTENVSDSISVKKPKDVNKKISAGIDFYQKVLPPVQFEHIKISSKISLEAESSMLPTLDATFYIVKDEKIWVNIAVSILNVARGIATQDGIKAYDKWNKNYIDSDFEYLNNLLNTNFVDYKSLEKLIMGRTFVRISDREFQLSKNASGYKMESVVNQKMENEGVIREYKVIIFYEDNLDLKGVYLQDITSKDELEINYDNWEEFSTYRMPKNVKITIKGSKNSMISIENTKFDEKEIRTPFSVPENYNKVEIK